MIIIVLALLLGQLVLLHGSLAAEKVMLSGTLRDVSTAEPLAGAHIRILGTSRGTMANSEGRYGVLLDPGIHAVVFSTLGYRPDTLHITLTSDMNQDVSLTPSDIIMPEVIVTSEDPANEIIRKAIAAKKQWLGSLLSYEFDAFTRQTLRRDTSIASITESFTKGYWQQGDTLREVVKQRRQTANIAAAFNVASVGRILNFNEDRVRFLGYSFVAPTATDAFDYYVFKLLRTHTGGGHETYEIKVTPDSRSVPLFSGTVSIAGDSYALVGIDVEPNEAFLVPFVKEKRLRYRQEFQLYEQVFWMPADIRIEGAFVFGIPGISFPRFVFDQTSVIYDYRINQAIPDSIFRKPRLIVDSTATKFDSTFWKDSVVLPLAPDEQRAYNTIDSTQTLDVQFRPGGLAMTIGGDGGAVPLILSIADVQFNRVEGLHVGAEYEYKELSPFVVPKGGVAYGVSSRLTTYLGGITVFATASRKFGFGGEVFRRVDSRPEQGYYGGLFNTLTSLLDKNDYYDYYRGEGWDAYVVARPGPILRVQCSFISEDQQTLAQRTNYSILYPSHDYRPNPPIDEGIMRSLLLDVRVGREGVPLGFVWQDAFELSVEHSSSSIAGSAFDFTRYRASVSYAFETFGESFLLKPVLKISATGGASSGRLPLQRLFSLESRSSGVAPFGVMRCMDVKEFSGTSYVAMNAEHNFRSIPFLALGIPFLYKNNLELVIHGGGARAWSKRADVVNTTDGWYYEAGFGISRILELLRADCTWRLSAPRGFAFSLGIAAIM